MVDPLSAPRSHRQSPDVMALPLQGRAVPPDTIPLTSFFGRAEELATVIALLERPTVRLLTLTGPGGSGKSRLAHRVLEIIRSDGNDGSAWVSLAPVDDPDLVLSTLAQALDMPDSVGQTLIRQVVAFLQERPFYLVLDNAEHLLDAVASLLTNLLTSCPQLKVLATSRVRLSISGEWAVPVAPLDPETARALFASRAEAADPTFAVTADNASTIDTICDRLDSLPLGIELAAARTTVLPPRALLTRLDHRLDLLTGGPRDAPVRLRNMRVTIAWSYDLLSESEQELFQKLGIFVGGFTLDAAQAIVGDGTDVLHVVSALVAASLVIKLDSVGNEPRFTMLETIREFALERLVASGEETTVRERHAWHMVTLAESLWESSEWPRIEPWMERLRPEIGNIRLALEWTIEHNPAATVQLAGALIEYWSSYGHVNEGLVWTTRALQRSPESSALYRARALMASGRFTMIQGNYDASTAFLTEAIGPLRNEVALSPTAVSKRLLTFSVLLLGDASEDKREFDRARKLFAEARQLADQHDVPMVATIAIMNLGRISHLSGDLSVAQELLEEALDRHKDMSGPIGVAHGHLFLGELLLARAQRDRAVEHLHAAFTFFLDLNHLGGVGGSLEGLSSAIVHTQPAEAVFLLGAAAAIAEQDEAHRQQFDVQVFARISELARTRLGEPAFAAAWEEGKRMSRDELRRRVDVWVNAILTVPTAGFLTATSYGLTPRELEVLRLVATGNSNREIAVTLFISVPTVKRHVTTILSKLDVPSRSAATAYAHTHSIL